MSSEIVNTTGEIPTPSSEVQQVAPISPNGTLNPNAAVFDRLNLMTLSDKSPGSETSPPAVSKWQENAEPQSPLDTMSDNLQFSPDAMNGFGPYTSPGPAPGVIQGLQDRSPDKLSQPDLKILLKHQLEYYFSRENLARDTYLISQMDSDNYVPIWTVANFNQVTKLTKDLELVKEALRDSPHLQVDSLCEKVRANVKRCIVVLREIPETTPVEEVKALFAGEGCPKHTGCEFAHNDYWYIQFESEESAQKAYRYLREEVKTFKGKPIMARIKAKPIHQTNFVGKNSARTTPQQQQQQQQQVVEPPIPPPPPPQSNMFSQQRHFQFPPVQTVFNGQQPFQYYPNPGMIHTWPPGQAVFHEPHMAPGFPNNGFGHSPLKPARDLPGNNAVRHGYQMNRTRFQNKPHHRDQPSTDRTERDSGSRPKTPSTNGTTGNNTINSTPTTASTGNSSTTSNTTVSSNGANRDSPAARSVGSFRTRESDEFSRRAGRPIRRRRGSSEDISKHSRQKENRASPVRHSKDDSDTIDLAPSHFPPLPTSPLAGYKQPVPLPKEFPEIKSPKPQPEKLPVSPLPSPTQTKQEVLPQPKPAEKLPLPKEPVVKQETKPPSVHEEPPPHVLTPRPAERLSYAQMAQKGPKPIANPPPSNQTKSPGK